ncbi:RHS repeat-associated core domain-containing protein [Pseudomonas sp. QTF5]|uniref:RHS repeat-associated core domain-containing protein n=1 Tax=Pseudomonas sp. QTF5 TaxID=1435425 RepID=UPI0004AF21C7|nr:RHS repeat-associated core domain-containing protein [Pseudomonas sp. QTF5]
MTTSSKVHSQAFGFMSYLSSGVDERTGQYTLSINVPEFQANELNGPGYPLGLVFNPMNTRNSGFGVGWDLRFTQFTPDNGILALNTGETYKVTSTTGGIPYFKEKKLDSFHFQNNLDGTYRVAHKSGLIEILKTVGGSGNLVALPHEIEAPSGHKIHLAYDRVDQLLDSISDSNGVLLRVQRNEAGTRVNLLVHPDGSSGGALANYELEVNSGRLEEIHLPFSIGGSWRLKYELKHDVLSIKEVDSPVGGREIIEYLDDGHGIPSLPGEPTLKIPRVTRHRSIPGFDQPEIEMTYLYSSNDQNNGHNFLGYGAEVSVEVGLDPLYKVNYLYNYGTTVNLIVDSKVVRSVVRTFNRFHLLKEEVTTQNDCVKRVSTTYHDVDAEFEQQPAQFQLPKKVENRWELANDSTKLRTEEVLTSYDLYGNLTEQTEASGIRTTFSYYQKDDVPGDPEGFVRSPKETIVYPASGASGNAQVLCTRHTYRLLAPLTGSASNGWLVPDKELLLELQGSNEIERQCTENFYNSTPENAFLHGRPSSQRLTLNGKTTSTTFAYNRLDSALAGASVLEIVETLTGFDHLVDGEPTPRHVEKINTRQISLLHGQPLLTFDDNNVVIKYTYDELQRVKSETVSPNTEYEATRLYSYTLASPEEPQASQTMTDVKGVTTRTKFDGLNRPVYEERQQADRKVRADEYRQTMAFAYDALGNLVEEKVFDWPNGEAKSLSAQWPNGDTSLVLTTRYEFNDWNEPRCTIGHDGIKVFEELDHLGVPEWKHGPVQRSWRETPAEPSAVSGETMTYLNLFEKPASVKRFNTRGDSTPISHHQYEYDGLGRTVKETDAKNAVTLFNYDHFGRMTENTLPMGAVVRRQYAEHSAEDLPIQISVDNYVLGLQDFDGLDRKKSDTTGGRMQTYSYDIGQAQPASVTTADEQLIRYKYRPQLGEEPWLRYLPGDAGEIEAVYEHDVQNARLMHCESEGLGLSREYFTTGEVKTETRTSVDGEYTMMYDNSLIGRQLSYTDVLGQLQSYGYDLTGRLVKTQLGTTSSVFTYDEFGRPFTTETQDGSQKVITTLTYDKFDRETKRVFNLNGVMQELTQVYNEVDALVQRTLKAGTEVLRDEMYDYDPRGRLVTYTCEGSQPPKDPYGNEIRSQVFRFDAMDNITGVITSFGEKENVARHFYENPDKTQLTRITNTYTNTDVNTDAKYPAEIKLEYDLNGNLIRDEVGRNLVYNALNQLLSVNDSSFKYDPQNTLTGSRSGDVDSTQEQRFYQKGELANRIQGAEKSTFVRGEGGVLAEQQVGADPKTLVLAEDNKNSPLCEMLPESSNNVAYSAYGYRSAEAAVNTSYGYNGELREADTGWYFLGNGYRALNPLLMRFHSPDSWSPFGAGGMNGYTYVLGNPIKWKDETGHMISRVSFIKQAKAENAAQFSRASTAQAVAMKARVKSASKSAAPATQQADDLLTPVSPTSQRPPMPFPKPKPNSYLRRNEKNPVAEWVVESNPAFDKPKKLLSWENGALLSEREFSTVPAYTVTKNSAPEQSTHVQKSKAANKPSVKEIRETQGRFQFEQ